MRKKILKKQVAAIILTLILAIILPQTSKAAVLQANPTTNSNPKRLTFQNWVLPVREMEKAGNAMGLAETIDSTTKLGTTSSNGLDVHMMKSTEYGAMAILSASGFGNPANTKTIETTTGNKTGVYMQTTTYEYVAGSGSGETIISKSAHRYFNTYEIKVLTSVKAGDALGFGWHGATIKDYLWAGSSTLLRGGSLGVFGHADKNLINVLEAQTTRAVVVSGTEF